jgi:signal transduction histidine kinase
VPHYAEDGPFVAYVGSAVDITDRRRAQDERERLLQDAEAASRAKDQFLATLSHELRTPLNAVVGWAHMLRSGKLDEAASARAIETIDRNARAQSQLISDILDISRIVSGKLRLNVRPVELTPSWRRPSTPCAHPRRRRASGSRPCSTPAPAPSPATPIACSR